MHLRNSQPSRPLSERPVLLFALIFTAIWLLHGPLLRLPYFWDEAGYFIPAAHDIYQTGDLIPKTTISNAHPPLVMLWLAMWWKLSNYSAAVTRTAMLLVSALGLLGVFKLGERVANRMVATAAVVLTALYPVCFAQSSLAQLDMPVLAATIWALYFHLQNRRVLTVVVFALAGLVKETALIGPMTIFGWELLCPIVERYRTRKVCLHPFRLAHTSSMLLTAVPLIGWYVYHFHRTGYVFGNPEYVRYNVEATLSPLRFVVALGMRSWHAFGYMNLFVLTLAALVMLREPVVRDGDAPREGIHEKIKILFGLLIAAHIVAYSVVGGAALARYMVPVIPLVILMAVSGLYRRMRGWAAWCAVGAIAFVFGLIINPPWRIAPEDNLAYSDFVHLHKDAAVYLQKNHPNAVVLTAWPGSDELNRPFLGYVTKPMTVAHIENFSAPQIIFAAQQRDAFDAVFVFNTKYEPPPSFFTRWKWWNSIQERFFDYHRDLNAAEIALSMQGKIAWSERRGGQWAAVIWLEHSENARRQDPPALVIAQNSPAFVPAGRSR